MISIAGRWYDGRTSAQTPAICRIYDSGAVRVEQLETGALLLSLPRLRIDTSGRLADTPRYLYFPNGEKFETDDNEAVDRLNAHFKRSSGLSLIHRLESRWPYVLTALLIMLLFLWGGIRYGVPFLAKIIAFRLPPSVFKVAGNQTLEFLDRSLLAPSQLEAIEQARLLTHFQSAITNHPDDKLTIQFRKGGKIGPNAFALPDGTIILTDEMVGLATDDDELLAVLVHEIGHVVHRHGMRTMVQDSLLGFALLAITGDVSGSSELFLGLPVLLTQLAYSRGFETEADQYALGYLRSHKIAPIHFAGLMRRIDRKRADPSGDSEKKWMNYLSTHPLTEKRLQSFEANGAIPAN
ncbi:MAG: M48 family metallopeptidase [Desulfobacterales bacterium]|nr:M48 family metallopeptidase [Desulfobacterales bacterium]